MPYATYEEAIIAENYPGYLAYFNISPEITLYLIAAARERWSDAKLKSVIYQSDWWKATPASSREAINLQLTDPASYQTQLANKADALNREMLGLGIVAPPHLLSFYAHQGFMQGLSDEQLRERFVLEQSPAEPTQAGGILGDTFSQVKARGQDWGVPLGDTEAWFVTKHVVSGRGDDAWIEDFMRDKAVQYYAGNEAVVSAVRDRGMTVKEFASPYIDMAVQELELAPGVVDLANAGWQKAIHHRDENGVLGPMDLADWQTHLRTDPIFGGMYDKTTGAREQSAKFQGELLAKFGALG